MFNATAPFFMSKSSEIKRKNGKAERRNTRTKKYVRSVLISFFLPLDFEHPKNAFIIKAGNILQIGSFLNRIEKVSKVRYNY